MHFDLPVDVPQCLWLPKYTGVYCPPLQCSCGSWCVEYVFVFLIYDMA